MEFEINRKSKTGKFTNVWKLNNTLLNTKESNKKNINRLILSGPHDVLPPEKKQQCPSSKILLRLSIHGA
jgi:hypothetical protein